MTPATIQRYQPGGDIFAELESRYGTGGALLIAQAALTGDRFAVNEAISRAKFGEKLDVSLWSNFYTQVTTDPFAAPLETANKVIGTIGSSAIFGLFKNPWVLLAVAGLVFYAVGGFTWLGGKLKLA